MTNKKYVKICRDKLLPISDSNHSLTSESRWLNDQESLVNISEYIRQNWDLDHRFLFTIEKTDTTITCGSTCHKYKVNLFYYFSPFTSQGTRVNNRPSKRNSHAFI